MGFAGLLPAGPGRRQGGKMKNPEYFRLLKNGQFVGFKRVVTEYLPASHSTWQLDMIEHDPKETQRLSKPAMGIESLKRERITSRDA